MCPGLLTCSYSSPGWQVVAGDNSMARVVTGMVEWQLVWVRKKRQNWLRAMSFFSILINWVIIHDPCVSVNHEMG